MHKRAHVLYMKITGTKFLKYLFGLSVKTVVGASFLAFQLAHVGLVIISAARWARRAERTQYVVYSLANVEVVVP